MKKVIGFYNSLEAHLLVISLAFTTLLIFVQVVMRYVFNNSLSWSEELARYVFIWQIWLGTSVSMKGNDHIRMDMLSNKLKGRGKLVLAIVANVILLLFCVFLVKYGFDLVMSMKARGNSSTALKIPMWIVYASLPFSQLVVGLRIIGQIVTSVKELGGGSGESEPKEAEA